MKILIFLAVWQRPAITEICFMGIKRLQAAGIHEIEALAVISEDSMKPLCDRYGIEYCEHENLPLGAKKNYGLSVALKKDFDYLVEIGSDDLLKTEFLSLYPLEKDFYALRDFIMLNSANGSCCKIKGRFGAGRAISKKALLDIGKLWHDNQSKRLDNVSMFSLVVKGYPEHRIESERPLAIDIKSDVNIWPYNGKIGVKIPLESALEGLGDDEKEAICLLIGKT